MKKITLERFEVPCIHEAKGMHTVYFGQNRGWVSSHDKAHAENVLLEHLEMRIHSAASQLEKLCKARRKIINERAKNAS